MKHTQWTVSDGGTRVLQGTETIADCAIPGQNQASWAVAKERAAFIVTACNAHDELVKACEEALVDLQDAADGVEHEYGPGTYAYEESMDKIRAAITHAKGD